MSSLYFVSVNVSALLKSFLLENCIPQNNQLVEDIVSAESVSLLKCGDSVWTSTNHPNLLREAAFNVSCGGLRFTLLKLCAGISVL